jgi:hypothetical protein
MELLLNLVWLLLVMPAYYLWRNARDAQRCTGLRSLQFLLALGCGLVLLFPVVSATDDLHAVRAEMEESSKRNILHTVSEKSSAEQIWHNPPAALAAFTAIAPWSQAWNEVRIPQLFSSAARFTIRAGRAPPIVSL